MPQDLLGVLRILEIKKWFRIEDYNRALKNMKFSRQEASSKPQLVPVIKKIKRLSGKAISQWVHIRNFAYILYVNNWIQNEQDPVFQLAQSLARLTDRITSESFMLHDVYFLEESIIEYLELRKEVYAEYPTEIGKCRPKHHYLTHIPSAVVAFGPPTSYWTARYESKHRIAKSIIESSKNFINVTHSISIRQQRRASSFFYHGMFQIEKFILPVNVRKKNELGSSELDKKLSNVIEDGDLVSIEMDFKSRKYVAGDIIVLSRVDQIEINGGCVLAFIIRNRDAYVLVRHCVLKESTLGFFQCSRVEDSFGLVNMESLQDSYPLMRRGSEEKFLCILHHHVGFEYT